MNVKILFTFQAIFVYKSYWLLIFKSEKDKSYSLIGVQGMLVVPNCWDVGTWGWLERKIESLFYEWTHLYMDLEDIMVISPYKWTILSMHLESYHHQNGFWKKKEDTGIWKWRIWQSTYPLGRLRKTSASEKNYSILYLTNCTNVLELVYFDFVYPP